MREIWQLLGGFFRRNEEECMIDSFPVVSSKRSELPKDAVVFRMIFSSQFKRLRDNRGIVRLATVCNCAYLFLFEKPLVA